jgi:KDO2-lipid IV(A) lauroyltransferase
MQHPGVLFMRLIAPWPLSVVRAMGWLLGGLLYLLAVPRRRVVMVNLALCFPQTTRSQRRRWARASFVYFAQAWLDRAWLWHADPRTVQARLRLTGDVAALQGDQPTIVFAPHFYGLDAGCTALTLKLDRPMCTIYTPQRNATVDRWLHEGRRRFGRLRLFHRMDGVKPIVSALRDGELFYLLPDMNFGRSESVFVPFYGVAAATVPSLARFARLGRAQIVPVVSRMTAQGYDIEVKPAWTHFPTEDVLADTALMNERLQSFIDTMPAQYYWVHKRFKDRPDGEPSVY